MDGEQNGTRPSERSERQSALGVQEAQQQEGVEQQAAQQPEQETKPEPNATGGTDARAYESQLAERDERIAQLESQIAEAAKSAEAAEGLREEIAALKAQGESDRIDFQLQLAGCRNVKAAPRRNRRADRWPTASHSQRTTRASSTRCTSARA